MPVKYVCSNCGHVLWVFNKVGQDYLGVPTPDEIRRIYGVCPVCKSEFVKPSIERIDIRVVKPVNRIHVTSINKYSVVEDALSEA